MPNKALRALYIYNGVFVLAASLLGPLYAVYVQQQGFVAEPGQAVLIISSSWAIFLVASTLFTYIVSKFGDSIKETEYLMLWGFLLRALVWILYIFAGNLIFLFILQIILGIGDALGSPSFNTLVARHVDKGHQVEEYADMNIIFNLSGALATFLGGVIVAVYGFPTLFIIMAILALVSFFGILLKPRKLL
jgi:MFS family permease